MQHQDRTSILRLIHGGRWAALAACGPNGPIASQVAYATEPGLASVLLLLSLLAAHTRALLENPRAALSIGEPDDGRDDPQTLRRLTLTGRVVVVGRDDGHYSTAAKRYLNRFPAARQLFGFSDFVLLRLFVDEVRYVGGLGVARTLSGNTLQTLENEE